MTTGSTRVEHNYYVSAYKILYSADGQRWTVYREPGVVGRAGKRVELKGLHGQWEWSRAREGQWCRMRGGPG